MPCIEIAYWFNARHVIYFDWRRLHRDATNTNITVPYEFTHPDPDIDETYSIQFGAEITTTFNVDIARLGYGYDFYKDDQWDLILTVGLHVMWIELGFEGEVGACLNEDCGVIDIEGDSSTTSIYYGFHGPVLTLSYEF